MATFFFLLLFLHLLRNKCIKYAEDDIGQHQPELNCVVFLIISMQIIIIIIIVLYF